MRDGSHSRRVAQPPATTTRAARIMARRFLVYAMVGLAGTAGQYAVLIAAVSLGWLTPVPASVLGAVVGATINFILNALITFRSELSVGKAARFFATAALAVAANGVLMSLLLSNFRIDYRLAQLIVTAVLLCFTFTVNSAWTFRANKAH